MGPVTFENGSFDEARFSDPQGMTLQGNLLYVADRKNHSLRALDLKNRTVVTVAGIGKRHPAAAIHVHSADRRLTGVDLALIALFLLGLYLVVERLA